MNAWSNYTQAQNKKYLHRSERERRRLQDSEIIFSCQPRQRPEELDDELEMKGHEFSPNKAASIFDRLVWDNFLENQITKSGMTNRKHVFNLFAALVEETFEGATLKVFGSCCSGLHTKDSDIDLAILEVYSQNGDIVYAPPSINSEVILRNLHKALQKRKNKLWCHQKMDIVSIYQARVPILKVNFMGLQCDISRGRDGNVDRNYLIWNYQMIDERVAPLLFTIKSWCRNRKIESAVDGSLSSFAQTLMVIQFLQIISPPVLPCIQTNKDDPRDFESHEKYQDFGSENKSSVADMLSQFFQLFAEEFPVDQYCVSVRYGNPFPRKKNKFQSGQKKVLCIEDPFDLTDNIARGTGQKQYDKIRKEFQRALVMTRRCCAFNELMNSDNKNEFELSRYYGYK